MICVVTSINIVPIYVFSIFTKFSSVNFFTRFVLKSHKTKIYISQLVPMLVFFREPTENCSTTENVNQFYILCCLLQHYYLKLSSEIIAWISIIMSHSCILIFKAYKFPSKNLVGQILYMKHINMTNIIEVKTTTMCSVGICKLL